MDNIKNTVLDSIDNYFNHLKHLGYINQKDENALLLLISIEETLDRFSFFVTEDDYSCIKKALNCLYGSNCIIDLPDYYKYVTIHKNNVDDYKFRISEDSMFRLCQEGKTRIA